MTVNADMLEVRSLTVRYGRTTAVDDVSLSLERGEIGCLVGASGCGKTSVLRAVAGFLRPHAGSIRIAGEVLSGPDGIVAPERRQVGIILQDLALFPHLDVRANVGFGLRTRDRAERERRIDELLSLTGLEAVAGAHPHELSGGQQQRVAIARAMAPRPRLLLLDEPFSSLDPQLRARLPGELRQLLREDGITALLVTHDQAEAFAMADRIGVMAAGRLHQWDTAYALYHRPTDRTVADFIGEGVTIPGAVEGDEIVCALGRLPAPATITDAGASRATILVRPDDVVHDDESPVKARIIERTFRGSHFRCRLALDDGVHLLCLMRSHHDHAIGEPVGIRIDLSHVVAFPEEN